MTRLLALAAALIWLTGACGDPAGSDAGVPEAGDYVATELPSIYQAGDKVSLTVRDGEITLSATCNTFSGQADWAEGTLTVTGLAGTEMGCPEDAMAQDEWLTGFVTDSPAWRADDGGIILTEGDNTLDFRPHGEVDPDVALEGTGWTLTGIGQGTGPDAAISSVPKRVRSTLLIADGQIELSPGCNSGSGSVQVEGDTLRLGSVMMTQLGCADERADVESAVLGALRGTVSYAIDGDTLTVTGADDTTLVYTAAE